MIHCEYFLVLYVPFPREELRLPIGLVFVQDGGRSVRYGLTRDWHAVRCLDPRADLTFLRELPSYFEGLIARHRHAGEKSAGSSLRMELSQMAESGLGIVRIATPRGVETEDPAREFDRLFDQQVAGWPVPASRSHPRTGSRRWIQHQLRQALDSSSIRSRFRSNVPVEEFTAPGDRFHLDFSYRPNGTTKYLHALSLEHDWNQSKVLSFTFERIRARFPAALTAIVSDRHPDHPSARACRQILEDGGISLCPTEELDGLVRRIEQEFAAA
jgi:hypothetical protein